MRRFLLLFCLLPVNVAAGQVTFFDAYDVAVNSYTYCMTGPYRAGVGRVYTSGSATTVTGSGTNFATLAAGYELAVVPTTNPSVATAAEYRDVSSVTSATELELTAAADWSGNSTTGYTFRWRERTCGTAITNGWHDVSQAKGKVKYLQLIVTTINATSLSFSIEGKTSGQRNTTATQLVNTITYTTTGSEWITIPEDVDAIRVGVQYNTADTGAQSVSAYLVW